MARWEELPEYERQYLAGLRLPEFDHTPWDPRQAAVGKANRADLDRRYRAPGRQALPVLFR